MFDSIFRSWKTSLLGTGAGLPQVVVGVLTQNWLMAATGVFTLLMGFVAKDGDVSGS